MAPGEIQARKDAGTDVHAVMQRTPRAGGTPGLGYMERPMRTEYRNGYADQVCSAPPMAVSEPIGTGSFGAMMTEMENLAVLQSTRHRQLREAGWHGGTVRAGRDDDGWFMDGSQTDDVADLVEALNSMEQRMSSEPSGRTVVLQESEPGAPPVASMGCPCPRPDCPMK